jgi:hypothetical protein
MRRDEAVFLIQSRFGGMEGEEDRIIAELQFAQELYERSVKKPWFLVTTGLRDVTEQGSTSLVGLDPQFLQEYEPGSVWMKPSPTTVKLLQKLSFDIGMNRRGTGMPTHYDLIGDQLHVFPVPDQTYELIIRYYGKDERLHGDIENKFLQYAPDLLIARAGLNIAKYAEPSMLQVFQMDEQEAHARLVAENEARIQANLDLTLDET